MNLNTKHIVESLSYRYKELLDHDDLVDFVPDIGPRSLHILNSWREHFEKRKVPFAIVQDGKGLSLWKIDEARHPKEMSSIER